MSDTGYSYYIEHIECILLFGIVSFLLSRIAIQKKFYSFPSQIDSFPSQLLFLHVLSGFAIYLASSLYLSPLFAKILPHFYQLSSFGLSVWSQLIASACSFFLLLCFSVSIPKLSRNEIWKKRSSVFSSSIFTDCLLGALTWLISFPIVTVIEQIADVLVYALFKVESFEQVAVRYLKMTLETPSLFVAALLMILIFAPLLEEFLFRGLLQTWLKKHLGAKAAILIAAFAFALFHISASHGVGNLSLVPSLFVFSCFLGFIYERQGSLFASISLHMTFNLISTLRILFLPNP